MKKLLFLRMNLCVLASLIILLSCGGGGGGDGSPGTDNSNEVSFQAVDFTDNNTTYPVNAGLAAAGTHCYVYVETGLAVDPTSIDSIATEFDNVIYPQMVANFGNPPDPGIDNDPKIYILLLNIKDGFGPGSQSFIAGYFDPSNEYPVSQVSNSNQKELLYMNANPALQPGFPVGGTEFFATTAHEFEHMIHWNADQHKFGHNDETWIDEAMATVARTYCDLGPDYSNVFVYENEPWNSLTIWGDSIEDYAVVYMWAQYFKDRFNDEIFRKMLENDQIGIAEVNTALDGTGADFNAAFLDWSIANFQGDVVPDGHTEWAFTSIDTHPGMQNGIPIPGLFSNSNLNPAAVRSPLTAWSVDYYWFTPANPPDGTMTWTKVGASDTASFVSGQTDDIIFAISPSSTYSFADKGYLIVQNAAGVPGGGDTIVHTDMRPDNMRKTPKTRLDEANASPAMRELTRKTGRPQPLCVYPWFRAEENKLKRQGINP